MTNWEDKFNEWCLKYEVMSNPFFGGIDDKFETYGEELDYVLSIANTEPARVWTLVDGDDGNLYIVDGYHLVNRVNYFVTKIPFEGKFMEVPYYIFEEEEDEVNLTDHYLAEQERPMFYGEEK
jgi:hypothetical protein